MTFLAYCLPVVVAAVLVFVVSSLIHMVIKWHQPDYLRFGNEDEIRDAIRKGNPAPGQYILPFCGDMKDAQTSEMQSKFVDGPVGMLILRKNGMPKIGANLAQWFGLNLLIAAVAVQIGAMALKPGADRHLVFHTIAMITFISYAGGSISDGVWKGQPWKVVAKDIADSLIYGIVSGMAATWLWPH